MHASLTAAPSQTRRQRPPRREPHGGLHQGEHATLAPLSAETYGLSATLVMNNNPAHIPARAQGRCKVQLPYVDSVSHVDDPVGLRGVASTLSALRSITTPREMGWSAVQELHGNDEQQTQSIRSGSNIDRVPLLHDSARRNPTVDAQAFHSLYMIQLCKRTLAALTVRSNG